MRRTNVISTIFILCYLCGSTALADPYTYIDTCPNNFEPAEINISVTVSTSENGCPLLEVNRLRRLVDRFFPGTTFAYPLPDPEPGEPPPPIPCLSGTIDPGSAIVMNGEKIWIKGTTESAQRIFPEASEVNPFFDGLFLAGTTIDGTSFLSGAAATLLHIMEDPDENDFDEEGSDEPPLELTLVLSDRFTVYPLDSGPPFTDIEDFEIMGAKGAGARGRLGGEAQIFNPPGGAIVNATFTVEGSFCIKI